jgi:hypothetical protein
LLVLGQVLGLSCKLEQLRHLSKEPKKAFQ